MKKAKILLVDDEESVRISLSKILTRKGYDVDTIDSGAKAIEAMNRSAYDLLLSDLKMPAVDGIKVLKAARKIAPDMGVIILTGHGEITSYLEAMDVGADEYMNKPVKGNELTLVIEKLLKSKKKTDTAK